jgi:hypothetical protein
MELNYWNSTSCKKASYNETRREWEVTVEREGREVTLRPEGTRHRAWRVRLSRRTYD